MVQGTNPPRHLVPIPKFKLAQIPRRYVTGHNGLHPAHAIK
jgi:hypothetical protein